MTDLLQWALDTGRIAASREGDWRASLAVDPHGMGNVLRSLPEGAQLGAAQVPAAGAPTGPSASGSRATVTPLVRQLAAARGVDLSTVKGTGAGGRIGKADVLAAAATLPPTSRSSRTSSPAATPSASPSMDPATAGVAQVGGHYFVNTGLGLRPVSSAAAYWFPGSAASLQADEERAAMAELGALSWEQQQALRQQLGGDTGVSPFQSDDSSIG